MKGIVTLDFETYFDQEYSLRRMTTENYVRDERFKALCLGLKHGENKAQASDSLLGIGILNRFAVVAHHAQFDGLILSHHYGVKPKFWFDTLSMARMCFPHDKSHSLEAIATKYGMGHKTIDYNSFKGWRGPGQEDPALWSMLTEGCANDVELTYKVFKKLLPHVPKEELKLIDLTIRMFTEPVLQLDKARVKAYMGKLQKEQEALLTSLGVDKTSLASAEKFAALLESIGVEPPTKMSPKTGKKAYAFAKTDQGFLELVNHDNEQVRLLAEARLNTKSTIGETRAGRLLGMAERGDLPVYLKYFGAHTGRWSGGDKLNFQNFPRGGELRKSLLAPEGFVLCVADLSQIEVRVLAWLAGEEWVLEAFRNGRDLYCEMASEVYEKPITKADKQERFLGKTLVLGAGYGVGYKKLKGVLKLSGIELTDEEAEQAIKAYRNKHPNIVRLWRDAEANLKCMYGAGAGGVEFTYDWGPIQIVDREMYLPNGAVLDYSSLAMADEGRDLVLKLPRGTTKIYGGKLVENVVQALARIVCSQAILKISERYKVVLTTHDEVVYLAPEDEAEEAMSFGLGVMKQLPVWAKELPLDAEGGYAKEYSK